MAMPAFKRLRMPKPPTMAPPVPADPEDEEPPPAQEAEAEAAEEEQQNATPEELVGASASLNVAFVDCVTFDFTDDHKEHVDKWTESVEPEWVEKLEALRGRYWKVAECFGGQPVFKKEVDIRNFDDVELYIIFMEDLNIKNSFGWYVIRDPMHLSEDGIYAYMPESDMYGAVHCPYWQAKPNKLVSIISIYPAR